MNAVALHRLRGSDIGMVFQDPVTYLNPVFTIGRQMAEVLRAHDGALSRAAVREKSIALLDSVRLSDATNLITRYPHELSGGMRQRVLIAPGPRWRTPPAYRRRTHDRPGCHHPAPGAGIDR